MSDSKLNPTRNNQSTEKALAIIEYLASQPAPARLRDISDALSLNVSTAARFLSALQNCGYAAQEAASQRYYLTYKICRIANQVSSATHLPTITHPHLVRLSEQFRKALHVSVERSMSMVCIDSADRLLRPQFHTLQVGEATPLHCTACGKLFLLIAKASGNELILGVFDMMRDTYLRMFRHNISYTRTIPIVQHRQILVAIQTRDMDGARRAMLEHLEDTMREVCGEEFAP